MRVLVCGSRDFDDRAAIGNRLWVLMARIGPFTVIEGDARGADRIAGEWADLMGVPHLRFPADWKRYGRAAGPIRNQQMLDEGRPDLVLAFTHDITTSKGTKDMVTRAQQAGLPVYIFKD